MNKAQLIDAIAAEADLTKADAKKAAVEARLAKEAEENPLFVSQAYSKTQPKTIFN